jgi:hypothetical protein
MTVKTQYIAPVSLWLVVRKRFTSTGLFVEPAWVGDGTQNGPAIFTSHILAVVYAHMRNKYHGNDDSNNWQVMPLQEFDLLAHVRECDGTLWCMMTFGAVLEDENSLIVKTGAPRIRYVPLKFAPPTGAEEITLSFNQWVFDFIRDEFRSIGLPDYEKQLEVVDEMDDATLALTCKYAIERINVCRNPSEREENLWGVYSPDAGMWVCGEETISVHAEHPGHQLH